MAYFTFSDMIVFFKYRKFRFFGFVYPKVESQELTFVGMQICDFGLV
jgi:hypothetical protein